MDTDGTTSGSGSSTVDQKISLLLRVLAAEGETGGPGQAVAAAYALAHLGQPGIEALALVLRDWGEYGWSATFAAIEALGASGDVRAVGPLRDVMRMPPSGGMLSEELRAAQALARLERSGVDALADVVQTRSMSPETRWAAASVLGKTGDEATALAPLLAALGDREDPLAAAGAATSLGELHSVDAIPALIAALGDEEFEFVANAAQGALYHIGAMAIPALIQKLADAPDIARRRAAWALSWLGADERARAGLFAALADADADVRAAAVCAQRNHGDTDALPSLQRIRQEDKGVSADFDTLAELAEEAIRAIEARAAGLEEPSPRDDEATAMDDVPLDDGETLYLDDVPLFESIEMSEENLANELTRLVALLTAQIRDEEDIERSVGAALSLAKLGPQGLAALANVARDASYDSDVRAGALDGLVNSGDETVALAALFDVLNNSGNSWLALQAANALGVLASPAAIPGLVEALVDDQYAVSSLIEDALVRIGETAIPALVAVLANGPDGQRRAAARALREMSADPRAATAFFAALSDPDPKVRELAIEGIAFPHNGWPSRHRDDSWSSDSFRDDPKAARALAPLLDDPDEPVRAAARNGLCEVGGLDDAALLERAARFSGGMDDGDSALLSVAGSVASNDSSAEIANHLRLLARGARGGKDMRDVWRAARALSHLGFHGLAALGAVVRDPDLYPRTIRIWAIESLGASGDARAIPPLLDALRGVVPDSSVEGYFTDLPDDRSLGEELRAAYALLRLGSPGLAALAEVSREPGATTKTQWAIGDALGHASDDTIATDEPIQ